MTKLNKKRPGLAHFFKKKNITVFLPLVLGINDKNLDLKIR